MTPSYQGELNAKKVHKSDGDLGHLCNRGKRNPRITVSNQFVTCTICTRITGAKND